MLLLHDKGDKYMPFGFDRRKAIQAVALLLKTRPQSQDNYMRLLKILYIADRESLKETGFPITGDRFVAMTHGTMLSRLLNLAKHEKAEVVSESDHEEWQRYIAREGDNDIRMISDPGRGALCDYEADKLQEVAQRYASCTQWDMRDITHKLPEYHDPGKSSKLISLRHYLAAVGMKDVTDEVIEEAEHSASMARLLRR